MAKKIYRVVSWGLLALTLVSILLLLRKPSLPAVEVSAEAARSFDQKLGQLEEAHQAGRAQEIRISEVELNSKLEESLAGSPAPPGPATLRSTTLRLEGDRIQAIFTVNLKGKDVYLTLGGKLRVTDGSIGFVPTDLKMGSLPVPLMVVERTLRERLNSPEMREHMRLPEFIKDVRIENGELVLQGQ